MATKPKNKIRLELVEPEHMVALAAALQTGAEKYGRRGYRDEDIDEITGALLRHLTKARMGEDRDRESGLPHTWHILACAAIMVSLDERDIKEKLHGEGSQPPVGEPKQEKFISDDAMNAMMTKVVERSMQRKLDKELDKIKFEPKDPETEFVEVPRTDSPNCPGDCNNCGYPKGLIMGSCPGGRLNNG